MPATPTPLPSDWPSTAYPGCVLVILKTASGMEVAPLPANGSERPGFCQLATPDALLVRTLPALPPTVRENPVVVSPLANVLGPVNVCAPLSSVTLFESLESANVPALMLAELC